MSRGRFQELKGRLRQQGYRLTPQRIALLQLLSTSESHPSAAWLHDQIKEHFPTTSLATVYKTLAILKGLGEVLELEFSQADNRYDGRKPYPHPHLICTRCRKIIDGDVHLSEAAEEGVSDFSGYQISSRRLDLYGLCSDCQSG